MKGEARATMWGSRTRRSPTGGFSLTELLVVLVVIGFILAMLLPAVARSKAKAQGLFCMNNLRQLAMAWTIYAGEHGDRLPGVVSGSFPGPGKWASGWLDFTSSPDNTNTTYLTSPHYAQLGPYVKTPAAYRCPADGSTVVISGKTHDRARSVSLNCWMNYSGSLDIGQADYVVFRKISHIQDPSPSQAWVFMDEREDSINDGMFQTNLKGRGKLAKIVDYPASYHNRAAGLAFADGRVVVKPWVDRRTTPNLKRSQLIELDVPSPDNPDVEWLQLHSSSLKPAPGFPE